MGEASGPLRPMLIIVKSPAISCQLPLVGLQGFRMRNRRKWLARVIRLLLPVVLVSLCPPLFMLYTSESEVNTLSGFLCFYFRLFASETVPPIPTSYNKKN